MASNLLAAANATISSAPRRTHKPCVGETPSRITGFVARVADAGNTVYDHRSDLYEEWKDVMNEQARGVWVVDRNWAQRETQNLGLDRSW